jgi:hypothetical protein
MSEIAGVLLSLIAIVAVIGCAMGLGWILGRLSED